MKTDGKRKEKEVATATATSAKSIVTYNECRDFFFVFFFCQAQRRDQRNHSSASQSVSQSIAIGGCSNVLQFCRHSSSQPKFPTTIRNSAHINVVNQLKYWFCVRIWFVHYVGKISLIVKLFVREKNQISLKIKKKNKTKKYRRNIWRQRKR